MPPQLEKSTSEDVLGSVEQQDRLSPNRSRVLTEPLPFDAPRRSSGSAPVLHRLGSMTSAVFGQAPTGSPHERKRLTRHTTEFIFGRKSSDVEDRRLTREQIQQADIEKKKYAEETCTQWLKILQDPQQIGIEEVDLRFTHENLLYFKNRYMTGCLLHYAVVVSAQRDEPHAESVQCVLEAGADLHCKVSFRRDGIDYDLEAVHLAAGLGCVPALRVLYSWAGYLLEDQVGFVNLDCSLKSDTDDDWEPFYAPIHEATYAGQKESVLWLLEKRADPSKKNKWGATPLFFVTSGFRDADEADLELIVKTLLTCKARLDARTNGKIPMEMAAAEDSSFPRRLLYLLAPSFQRRVPASIEAANDATNLDRGAGASRHTYEHSFIDDLCSLATLNMAAANQLARQLLESDDHELRRRLWADAQKENAVDCLANLFHMAPMAAADMLEMLLVKPLVQDAGRHPIRKRAVLWSPFATRAMRCSYQSDFQKHPTFTDLNWPLWKFDAMVASKYSESKDSQFLEEQPDLAWHLKLVRAPTDSEAMGEFVDDVDTKVLLLPNVLDIDILMALSRTREMHRRVFAKMSVQAIIHSLWEDLMSVPVFTRIFFNLIDLAVQVNWGLTNLVNGKADEQDVDTNSPLYAPMSWSILFGSVLRDLFNLGWWFRAHHRKWKDHVADFREWEEARKATQDGTSQNSRTPEMEELIKRSKERPPGLHALWRPQAFFTRSTFFPDVFVSLLKLYFLWDVGTLGEGTMSDYQQAVMTGIIILQIAKFIYMLRLTSFGKQVTTILRAFFDGAITEMLLITSIFFCAVYMVCAMLKHKDRNSFSPLLFLYRGLLFGDGEALDYMGLDPKQGYQTKGMPSWLMLAMTLFFNIVIVNLMTAVYGNEYARLQREQELHFQLERVTYCCELLLGLQKLRLSGSQDAWIKHYLKIFIGAAVCLAFALLWMPWVNLYSCIIAAVLLAVSQVGIQAVLLESHWFPWREKGDGREGPIKDHYLWICHRSDYSEDMFIFDEVDKGMIQDVIDEKIGALDQSLRTEVGKINSRLDSLATKVDNAVPTVLDHPMTPGTEPKRRSKRQQTWSTAAPTPRATGDRSVPATATAPGAMQRTWCDEHTGVSSNFNGLLSEDVSECNENVSTEKSVDAILCPKSTEIRMKRLEVRLDNKIEQLGQQVAEIKELLSGVAGVLGAGPQSSRTSCAHVALRHVHDAYKIADIEVESEEEMVRQNSSQSSSTTKEEGMEAVDRKPSRNKKRRSHCDISHLRTSESTDQAAPSLGKSSAEAPLAKSPDGASSDDNSDSGHAFSRSIST